MRVSATSITTFLLTVLTGQTLAAPATTPTTEGRLVLEKRCDCSCNMACYQDCFDLVGLNPALDDQCVLGCVPYCGCSEYSEC